MIHRARARRRRTRARGPIPDVIPSDHRTLRDAVAVAESTINAVAAELDGSLLRPEDEGYAESVRLWNAMAAKRPAVVIRAGSVGDVVRAVTTT